VTNIKDAAVRIIKVRPEFHRRLLAICQKRF